MKKQKGVWLKASEDINGRMDRLVRKAEGGSAEGRRRESGFYRPMRCFIVGCENNDP